MFQQGVQFPRQVKYDLSQRKGRAAVIFEAISETYRYDSGKSYGEEGLCLDHRPFVRPTLALQFSCPVRKIFRARLKTFLY